MTVLKDRYTAIGLAVLVAFITAVSAAYAYTHYTNNVEHGLFEGAYAVASTKPVLFPLTYVAGRHYSPDGSWNELCAIQDYGTISCAFGWGDLPCQKRSVNGAEGQLSRHWVRRTGCPGSLHG